MFNWIRNPMGHNPRAWPFWRIALTLACALLAIELPATANADTRADRGAANSLQSLVSEVLSRHPQIAVQQAVLRSAESGLEGAQWQFFPTPSVTLENAAVSDTDTSYVGSRQVATLGLRQTLWSGGRLTAIHNKAKATVDLNSAQLAESRLQLSLRVIQSYGDWVAAHEKQKVYATGLKLHQQLREMVVRRVREGQSAPSDQILAEERLAILEADAMASDLQKRTAILRLGQLVGRPLNDQDIALRPATAQAVASLPALLLRKAEDSSPTLARYRAIAEAQRNVLEERKADQWPEVYARLERQYGNYSVPGMAAETRAFVGLSTRFGAGLSVQSSIAEATGQVDAALAEIEVQRLSLQEQVLLDYTSLSQTESRRLALQQAAMGSRQVLESWDRQFLSGRKTWQDLMNSAREQIQLEAQIADLEASRLVAYWRLMALTEFDNLLSLP